jgi:hypothetical protein
MGILAWIVVGLIGIWPGRRHDRFYCCGVCRRGALSLVYALAEKSLIQILFGERELAEGRIGG